MQKENSSENSGFNDYDWDVDFDFDFEFGVVDYFLMILYAIFILPFEFIWKLGVKPFLQFVKDHARKTEDMSVSLMKKYHPATGPYCHWPRGTH